MDTENNIYLERQREIEIERDGGRNSFVLFYKIVHLNKAFRIQGDL